MVYTDMYVGVICVSIYNYFKPEQSKTKSYDQTAIRGARCAVHQLNSIVGNSMRIA